MVLLLQSLLRHLAPTPPVAAEQQLYLSQAKRRRESKLLPINRDMSS
jgi:hypothetical protein